MSDRERWIVYPLLLMAIGLALQPRFRPIDAQFKTLKCEKLEFGEGKAVTSLTCDKLIAKSLSANRANVAVELNAARTKSSVLSGGTIIADAASLDKLKVKEQSASRLQVADAEGVVHAELRATPNGGQLDIVRYAHAGNLPSQDRNVRIFATDENRNLIPLGIASLHLVGTQPSQAKSEAGAAPKAPEPSEPR